MAIASDLVAAHERNKQREELRLERQCDKGITAEPTEIVHCRRYKLYVSPAVCALCHGSNEAVAAEAKQKLIAASTNKGSLARVLACIHRGPKLGTREKSCCGNKKKVEYELFQCASLDRQAIEPDCWLCENYQAGEP